jgi:hypothetical protein
MPARLMRSQDAFLPSTAASSRTSASTASTAPPQFPRHHSVPSQGTASAPPLRSFPPARQAQPPFPTAHPATTACAPYIPSPSFSQLHSV